MKPLCPTRFALRPAAQSLLLALLCLALAPVRSFGAPVEVPGVVTNYVLVTNVVIVTNYVITTQAVLATNALPVGITNSALPDLSWVPPEDGFDWIQLKSGEWLKGRIKGMQERKLDFDSEELELLTFDWKNIRQLRSSHLNELLFGDKQQAAGSLAITPGLVTVGGPAPRTFPRGDLQSIAPGGSKERDYWSGKVSSGLTLHAGNTRSVDYNAQASLQRRTPETRLRLDYIGNVSRADAVESANNHRLNMEFDYWLSRRLYLILPQAEYFQDPFQHIRHRLTLGGGVGYDLIDRSGLEWNISTGPAYQQSWFDSVEPGDSATQGQAALTFGSKFDWEITQRIELVLEYRGQYTSRAVGETLHHAVATLSVDLTKRLDLNVSLVWDRIQDPKTDGLGAMPKQDDFRLVVGLGVHL